MHLNVQGYVTKIITVEYRAINLHLRGVEY